MFYYKKYKDFLIRRIFDLLMLFYKPGKNQLEKILAYSSGKIDFYRGKGSSAEGYEIIDKKLLMDNFHAFVKKGFKIKNTGLTSGTTGTPGVFYRDIRSMAMEQYFQNKYFDWKGTTRIFFRGERIFDVNYTGDRIYRELPLIKEIYVSSFHVNDRTLADLVEKLVQVRDKSLWAYPSSAYMLAEYCLRNGIKLDFKIIAVSSEVLMDYQREIIEKAFGCKVKDWYGQAERVAALIRCEHGNYHEMEDYSYVEYLPVGSNTYEIVGTTLYNRIMPIIRYNVHDLVEISPAACPCGNKGKNIVKIHGRSNSYIELPNGKLHETTLAFLFKGMDNVVEAQVVQKKDKTVLVKVVRAKGFSEENHRTLSSHIAGFIPAELFRIEYADSIERDPRGKFRYVINEGIG